MGTTSFWEIQPSEISRLLTIFLLRLLVPLRLWRACPSLLPRKRPENNSSRDNSRKKERKKSKAVFIEKCQLDRAKWAPSLLRPPLLSLSPPLCASDFLGRTEKIDMEEEKGEGGSKAVEEADRMEKRIWFRHSKTLLEQTKNRLRRQSARWRHKKTIQNPPSFSNLTAPRAMTQFTPRNAYPFSPLSVPEHSQMCSGDLYKGGGGNSVCAIFRSDFGTSFCCLLSGARVSVRAREAKD